MKKIIYFIFSLQMMSCDFSKKEPKYNALKENYNPAPTSFTMDNKDPVTPSPDYMNTAFGFSVPKLSNLKRFNNQQTQSLCFVDAQTESTTDLLLIVPFTESLDEIAQQLTDAGTPYQKADGNIIISVDQPGLKTIGVYAESPKSSGGLAIMRITSGESTFSESTVRQLSDGILFYEPQASLEERKQLLALDSQRQKQGHEQKSIESLKRQRVYDHGMHEILSVGDN